MASRHGSRLFSTGQSWHCLSEIEQAFTLSEQFFALPVEQKQRFPLKAGLNAGWEFRQQVRPSTGLADQKESYQITLPHMEALWPEQELVADFQSHLLNMEYQAWQLDEDSLLLCRQVRL